MAGYTTKSHDHLFDDLGPTATVADLAVIVARAVETIKREGATAPTYSPRWADDAFGKRPLTNEGREEFEEELERALQDPKYMGHASITITLDRYGHLLPGNEPEAASLLDAYLQRELAV